MPSLSRNMKVSPNNNKDDEDDDADGDNFTAKTLFMSKIVLLRI